MKAQGINYVTAAENIYAGGRLGVDAYAGWVNSSGHRGNMLGGWRNLGVGAGYTSTGLLSWFMTQDFYTEW